MYKNTLKEIATSLAISFIFTALLVIILYFTCYKTINKYASLVNTASVKLNNTNNIISYNSATKRLINYPVYNQEFATLKFDRLNVELPIYHGDSLRLLRNGIGHYAGSYFPGENGTIILAGHYTEDFFRSLYDLFLEDIITIETTYGLFTYVVDDIKVISEKEFDAFPIQNEEEMLIMYTCYPLDTFGRKSERYVVYAHLEVEDYV